MKLIFILQFLICPVLSLCPECNCKTTYSPTISPTYSPTYSPTVSPTFSPTSKDKCIKPIDLIFIVDRSRSIGDLPYRRAKRFIRKFLDLFDISKNDTHVGIIEFSTKINKVLKLTGDNQQVNNFRFSKKVNGWTSTHLAFKMCYENFMPYTRNNTVIILVTDGNPRNKRENNLIQKVYVQTNKIYNLYNNTIIVPIAVGNKINKKFLNNISKNKKIFKSSGYNKLFLLLKKLFEYVC